MGIQITVFLDFCHVLQGSGLVFFNHSKSIQVICVFACYIGFLVGTWIAIDFFLGKSSRCTVFLASNKKGWIKNPFLISFSGVSSTIRAALGFPKDPVRGPRLAIQNWRVFGEGELYQISRVHPESSQNFLTSTISWYAQTVFGTDCFDWIPSWYELLSSQKHQS